MSVLLILWFLFRKPSFLFSFAPLVQCECSFYIVCDCDPEIFCSLFSVRVSLWKVYEYLWIVFWWQGICKDETLSVSQWPTSPTLEGLLGVCLQPFSSVMMRYYDGVVDKQSAWAVIGVFCDVVYIDKGIVYKLFFITLDVLCLPACQLLCMSILAPGLKLVPRWHLVILHWCFFAHLDSVGS